jgi:hypothetical protein
MDDDDAAPAEAEGAPSSAAPRRVRTRTDSAPIAAAPGRSPLPTAATLAADCLVPNWVPPPGPWPTLRPGACKTDARRGVVSMLPVRGACGPHVPHQRARKQRSSYCLLTHPSCAVEDAEEARRSAMDECRRLEVSGEMLARAGLLVNRT